MNDTPTLPNPIKPFLGPQLLTHRARCVGYHEMPEGTPVLSYSRTLRERGEWQEQQYFECLDCAKERHHDEVDRQFAGLKRTLLRRAHAH